MSKIKIISFKLFISIVFLLCYSGCSDRKKQPTVNTIIHPENWISEHKTGYAAYKEKTGCTNCHGIDSNGGNSHVSCFSTSFEGQSCHIGHPDGWVDPALHGAKAKLSDTTSDTTYYYGFSNCQKCHGEDFSGGVVNKACYTCHGVSAPHPRAPWTDRAMDTSVRWYDSIQSQYSHYKKLDQSNLSVCFICHAKGRYSDKTHRPDTTNINTVLGCKNNSICHPN